jgi:hypothetical protein
MFGFPGTPLGSHHPIERHLFFIFDLFQTFTMTLTDYFPVTPALPANFVTGRLLLSSWGMSGW